MCAVLLPPGVNPIAFNKIYIISYHINIAYGVQTAPNDVFESHTDTAVRPVKYVGNHCFRIRAELYKHLGATTNVGGGS
jgi:hypothetical protein